MGRGLVLFLGRDAVEATKAQLRTGGKRIQNTEKAAGRCGEGLALGRRTQCCDWDQRL